MNLRVGSEFRKYDEYREWYETGAIRELNAEFAVVDFGDYWAQYPVKSIRVYYPDDGSYIECLVSGEEGTVVRSFNS